MYLCLRCKQFISYWSFGSRLTFNKVTSIFETNRKIHIMGKWDESYLTGRANICPWHISTQNNKWDPPPPHCPLCFSNLRWYFLSMSAPLFWVLLLPGLTTSPSSADSRLVSSWNPRAETRRGTGQGGAGFKTHRWFQSVNAGGKQPAAPGQDEVQAPEWRMRPRTPLDLCFFYL